MRLKTSLIVQQGVMIPQTETPVVSVTEIECSAEVASVANFLRSGCPSVQISIPPSWVNSHIVETRGFVRGELDLLSLSGVVDEMFYETFRMSWPDSDNRGRILIIRRTVAQRAIK